MNNERDKLERDKLVEKLREIAKGSRRSKTVRLREIFEDIEAAKADGATNKEIVAGLSELNLIFDVNNFKNAVSRIRKERTIEALTRAEPLPASLPAPAANQSKLSGAIAAAKSRSEVGKKQVVKPVVTSSGKRRSILNVDKGVFGDLDPPPADGEVGLKQK